MRAGSTARHMTAFEKVRIAAPARHALYGQGSQIWAAPAAAPA